MLKVNDIFLACGKEIQLIHSIKKEDFVNKICFNNEYTPTTEDENDENKQTEKRSVSRSFKRVLTDQSEYAFNNAKRLKNSEGDILESGLLCLPELPESACQFYTNPKQVIVDLKLTKCLRDHQREGIEFMYKCIMGFYDRVEGCILADEMGKGFI